MSAANAKSRWRRWGNYLLIATAMGLVLAGIAAWYTTTQSFQNMVRRRLVAQLERVTGGRVELGSFHIVPFRFRIEARNLTIHGREAADQVPYAHLDRLIAEIKIISVVERDFGFSSVVLDRPIVHIIVYPDGSTNQPEPKIRLDNGKSPVEDLFSLSISHLEVRHGMLLWNDRKLPLDFEVSDLASDMTYSLLHRRYDGNLLLGKVNTQYDDYGPLAWTAELHFSLERNALQIKSAKATSGHSRFQGTGQISNFVKPVISGSYGATVDMAEMAAIARRNESVAGTVEVNGKGSWSAEQFSASGRLIGKELKWRDSEFDLHDVDLSGDFAATPLRLTVSQVHTRLLGGSVTGDLEFTNWQNPARSARNARSPKQIDEPRGVAHLRINSLSAGEMAAALASPKLPFRRMKLAGSADGAIEARWTGALRNLEADIRADVAAPSRFSAGQLPVEAHIRASYRNDHGELEISQFNAHTPGSQLQASGTLSASAALNFTAKTTDLHEWQPILAAWRGPAPLPITLHGHAAFEGTVTGKLPNVTISGNLQAEDFDIQVPATAQTAAQQVHWDLLTGNVQLSKNAITLHNGILRHDNTEIDVELHAGLRGGTIPDDAPLTAALTMKNTNVAEVLALAGYSYPIYGTADVQLNVSGTRLQPQGDGRLALRNGQLYGQPVERLAAGVRFAGGEVQLFDIHASRDDERLTGDAAYNFSARTYRFNLQGTNFDLARMPKLQWKRMAITGRADFTAQGSGTLQEPTLNAHILLRELAFDKERAGNFTIDASTSGADLKLTGRSEFENAELAVDGTIRLRGNWPSTIDLHFQHLDVDPLLRTRLQGRVTGHSAIAGEMQLRGPLRQPGDLTLSGKLSEVELDVEGLKFRNNGPVQFSSSRDSLQIDPFRLVGERTDFTAGGTVQLTGERKLDLQAHGRVNLRLIQKFNSDFTSSGDITMDMTVGGTLANPITQGRVEIADGAISYVDLPSGLSNLNGSLRFSQNRVQIESLNGRTGGGQVNLAGYATLHDKLATFDLTVKGQDVRLRYPPGVSSTANVDVHWVGSSTSSTLSGDVTVTRLSMTPGFDFAAYLEHSTQVATLPQTNPLLNSIHLDMHIVTTPELQMQTAIVRLSGDADLHLRGTAAKPALLGRADVIEGEVYFNGTKYHLERGDVNFLNPAGIAPVLDLQMTTRVRDYDITVAVSGEPSKPRVSYRSEPPLPAADIVGLLAMGRTREESAQLQSSGQSAFSQEASNAILTEAINATVSSRVQRLFGGSRIKIDPQGLTGETNPVVRGPSVTIEQEVANNLTVTYSTNVAQTSQQIIQVEYNLSRNVSIVALRDQNGVVSFDVRIRRRKK